MNRRVLLSAILAACVPATTAFAADHFAGIWKSNNGRSKVNIEAVRNGLKASVDGTDDAGKPTHDEWTATFDGKDHPRGANSRSGGYVALKKIDAHTYELVVKDKDRKFLLTRRAVHSPDGKTRTVTVTHADGRITQTVYTRQ